MTHDPSNAPAVPADNTRDWLDDVLGGLGDGAATQYLCRPSVDDPQLLVPLRSRAAATASMRRHHDARTPREVAVGAAAELAARLGILQRAGGEVTELAQFRAVDELARLLGETRIVAAIGAGPPRRNRKPVIQLLRPDGSTVGFAKVGWSDLTRQLVTNEARWLAAVAGRLPDELDAPRVLLHEEIEGNDIVVTTPLIVRPRLTKAEEVTDDVVVALGRCLGSETTTVRQSVAHTGLDQSAAAETIDLARLLERHGDVEIEVGLWHGDFTPWNMATTPAARLVWDWEFAGDGRPIGFDLIHREMERVRRAAPGNEQAAVDAATSFSSSELRVDPDQLEAIRCLYLAEIVVRETRLAGQGWVPESLGPLDQVAAAALRARLT